MPNTKYKAIVAKLLAYSHVGYIRVLSHSAMDFLLIVDVYWDSRAYVSNELPAYGISI